VAEETNYEKLLAELEEERAGLDLMINFIKRRMGQSEANPAAAPSRLAGATTVHRFPRLAPDTFFRMTVPDAIRMFLNIAKRPQNARDITNALESGGLTHRAKNLYQTVFPTLMRMKDKDGTVVRLKNGDWGLAEWYSGSRKTLLERVQEDKAVETEPEGES
jgi:hypothetical protein